MYGANTPLWTSLCRLSVGSWYLIAAAFIAIEGADLCNEIVGEECTQCNQPGMDIGSTLTIDVDCTHNKFDVEVNYETNDRQTTYFYLYFTCDSNATKRLVERSNRRNRVLHFDNCGLADNYNEGTLCWFHGYYNENIYTGAKYEFIPFSFRNQSCTIDTNECALKTDGCAHNCSNTIGSFECSCRDGYELEEDGKNCTDVDECVKGTHNCDTNANCTNTEGSFFCSSCNPGYTGNGTNGTCSDIDECLEVNQCDMYANCTNTIGNYLCKCNPGYSGSGFQCKNINECDVEGSCHDNANCTDVPGSFTCLCLPGYTGDGFNICTDVDECELGTAVCHDNATCENTVGSYNCSCNEGFSGNGFDCTDNDECASGTNDCAHNCSNTVGGFECSCRDGYDLDRDGKNCTDEDECVLGTAVCHDNATCENTVGSYNCSCKEGFSGDGLDCTDTNECDLQTDGCAHNCSNTIGSFECSCRDGYELEEDGKTCTVILWIPCVISGFLVLCVVAAVIGGVTLLLFTIQHKHRTKKEKMYQFLFGHKMKDADLSLDLPINTTPSEFGTIIKSPSQQTVLDSLDFACQYHTHTCSEAEASLVTTTSIEDQLQWLQAEESSATEVLFGASKEGDGGGEGDEGGEREGGGEEEEDGGRDYEVCVQSTALASTTLSSDYVHVPSIRPYPLGLTVTQQFSLTDHITYSESSDLSDQTIERTLLVEDLPDFSQAYSNNGLGNPKGYLPNSTPTLIACSDHNLVVTDLPYSEVDVLPTPIEGEDCQLSDVMITADIEAELENISPTILEHVDSRSDHDGYIYDVSDIVSRDEESPGLQRTSHCGSDEGYITTT